VDATRCISYLTIEHKGEIDKKYHTDIENWVFGCDICQDVCPWNSKAKLAQMVDLHPRPKVTEKNLDDWLQVDEEQFNKIFEGSAVRRTKYSGFIRNLEIIQNNL
jgi:epoxyqueuosine reductase